MRCSRCDMLLSPNKTSCPRCGTLITDDRKKEGGAFAFAQALSKQRADFAGTAVKVAPFHYNWEPQTSNEQDMPFAVVPTPTPTPLASKQEEVQTSTRRPTALAFAAPSPKTGYRSMHIGFGLAGLCIGIACLLLVSVSMIAQTLPQTSTAPHLTNGSSSIAHNTDGINLSSQNATAIVSPTVKYPGSHYISNAQTAVAIDFVNEQPTLPTNTFRAGQKIYITFKVQPNGHAGAICLLWYINATQFSSYPFALDTTTTTSAYSYAATSTTGQGYVQIYWESTPSCVAPNKMLGASVSFTIIES